MHEGRDMRGTRGAREEMHKGRDVQGKRHVGDEPYSTGN